MRWCLWLLAPLPLAAAALSPKAFDGLEYRAIGPAIMGGRIADVEGVPGDPRVVYVASASGGLFKTTSGGMQWTPLFEREGTISIGDIALEPGNPNVIWLGAGEANPRNSVSFGDGVYRSTDGGRTWRHLGLTETERISRILIHPSRPDTVYVGALGHIFGKHEDRGVFMTRDGGKTWKKSLYIDDEHGVADMDMDPRNPNILYAALWRFQRKPWTHSSGSDKGGIWRSSDGGQSWTRLTAGLPKLLGRVGVKVAPSNPDVVYVIAESNEGTLFRSEDRGETFRQVSKEREIVSRGFYYADMRVDPSDENRVWAVASNLFLSVDGGKTFQRKSPRTHVDYHALWIDPTDTRRMWQGQDGGVAVSMDRGETWQYVNNIPLAQFYQITADNRQPFYWVHGGLQDNGSWTGPSRTREPAGILNDDWRMVSFGDGFHVVNHRDDPDIYLTESQGGNVVRMDLRTREQQLISPQPRSGAGGPAGALKYRFNWNSPILVSPHDSNTVYLAGNVLFRSTDFGRNWTAISGDLTTDDKEKQQSAGGPVWYDNSTAENHCTIISLSESPLPGGPLWVGTDDGNLQVSTDGGRTFRNVAANVPGVPAHSPVSHVEASRAGSGIAYAAFDRHMFDDFRPYVYVTRDGGQSWTSISANLPPKAYVHVLREDPKNLQLLYAGTELGLYVSNNGGQQWHFLGMKNLPRVAVHDIQIHPRENDLILATHGRGVMIFDDLTPLQQWTEAVAGAAAHLFAVRPAIRHTVRFTRYGIGQAVFTGANPPYGALITYWLREKAAENTPLRLEILDGAGKRIRVLDSLPRQAGLNRVAWDLRSEPAAQRQPPRPEEEEFGGGDRGPQVLPGTYTVRFIAGALQQETKVEVRLDPSVPVPAQDLVTQREYAVKLRDMLDSVNRTLKMLDSLKEQAAQIDKTTREQLLDARRDLAAALADYGKQIAAMQNRLGRAPDAHRLETPPGLAEDIAGLLRSIDGVNAAPTAAMRELFGELEGEYRTRMREASDFLARTVPAWNEALRKWNAPVLVVGKPPATI